MNYVPPPVSSPSLPSSTTAAPAPTAHAAVDRRSASSSTHTARSMPRVGETRCYWALLNDDLRFLFLDPVLAHHLEDQRHDILRTRLLDFVHPDELQSATADLKGMLDSRTLHGSVTRVRFCRLSSIRKRLGFEGIPVVPEFMERGGVFYNDEYMPVNLVINVATDGLVLCFIHAVIDIGPEDNDERHRNKWTNWCGTTAGGLSDEHTASLRQILASSLPSQQLPYGRVFQVLRNLPGRPAVFSWPPDLAGNDFAQLANRVEIEDTNTGRSSASPDASTSCTRRFKSEFVIPCSDGMEREVESIFVPYGCIVFACHRTKSARSLSRMYGQPNSIASYPYHQQHHAQHQQPSYSGSGSGGPAPPSWNRRSGDDWAMGRGSEASAAATVATSLPPMPQSYTDNARSPSESTSSSARNSQTLPEAPLGNTETRRGSGGSRRSRDADDDSGGEGGGKEKKPRVGGAPPGDVTKCSNCKIKTSPEWRKGPSGKKDLCNACGLRYARSRAKKEGNPPPGKKGKKDSSAAAEKEGSAGPSRPANGRKGSAASTVSAAGGSYAREYPSTSGELDAVSERQQPPPPLQQQPPSTSMYATSSSGPVLSQVPLQSQSSSEYPHGAARMPSSPSSSHSQPYYPSQHPQHLPQPQHPYADSQQQQPHPPPQYGQHQALSMLSRAAEHQTQHDYEYSASGHHHVPHHHHVGHHDRSPGPAHAGPVYVR